MRRKTSSRKTATGDKPLAKEDGRRSDAAINAYAQHRVERWFDDHPKEDQAALAKLLDLSDSFVTRIRKSGDGVGWRAARQLAGVLGMSLAEFVAEADRFWLDRTRGGGELPLNRRRGWEEARARVIQEHGADPAEVDEVGKITAQLSQPLNSETLWLLVIGAKHAPVTNPPRKRKNDTHG